VACAVGRANALGVRVIANLSPFDREAIAALRSADTWIVNETEWSLLTGGTPEQSVCDWAQVLKRLGCAEIVITQGADPTLHVTERGMVSITPPKVTPVDTVGAGDAFAGAFAVASSEGKTPAACLHFANAAGALATLEPGAQTSIPRRQQIEKLLHETGSLPGSSIPSNSLSANTLRPPNPIHTIGPI
jgi:ribokinase